MRIGYTQPVVNYFATGPDFVVLIDVIVMLIVSVLKLHLSVYGLKVNKVDACIMSQYMLWVIHTNKCGSIQLLGQYSVPYEIYHPINCIHYPLYS